MKKISIRGALKAGWNSFMLRPWYLFGLSLGVFLLFAIAMGNAVVTALSYIVYGGYMIVLIRHYHGEQVVFDDLFTIDNRWVYFAFLGLIKTLLIMLGLILFIVPGIYLAIRFMFAEFYVINDGMRPIEALRASSALTKGHWWKLFWYSIVVSFVLVAGLVFFVVGLAAAGVIVLIASFKLFEALKAEGVTIPEIIHANL